MMEQKMNFKCAGDGFDEIPEAVISAAVVSLPNAHRDRNQMALLAMALKQYNGDVICRIPFCVTVEAEAFGGNIKLGNEKIGPRVNETIFKRLEDLQNIEKIDLYRGRIKEVLEALKILSASEKAIALNVTGPFTIISALVEPAMFYKELRKNKDAIERFMQMIEDGIVDYILEGIQCGATIISYADPAGSLDIVGPKIFNEVVGRTACNILKRIEPHLDNTIIHLCGKLSVGLEKMGYIETKAISISKDIKYGDAILEMKDRMKAVKFIGNACIKRTPLVMKQPILWEINKIKRRPSID